jgi:PAS domain S-box-containing protein
MKDTTGSRDDCLQDEKVDRLDSIDAVKRSLESSVIKFRTMVEHANDAIFVIQDDLVKYANPKALSLARVTGEQLGKFKYTDLVHPEDRGVVVDRYNRRLKGENFPNVYPIRILTPQGETVWTELNSVRFDWEEKPAALCIIRDITSQRLIEQHGFRTESLETIRTLAGGLAHSFNNLLMGIQGRVSLMEELFRENEIFNEHLEGIRNCIKDASRLTKQMLGFAQAGKYKVQPVDLNEVARTVFNDFRLNDKNIVINTAFLPGLRLVAGDRAQLESVILNLLLNAWQAISGKGEITIKTENIMLSGSRLSGRDLKHVYWVKLSVTDDGRGIDPDTINRVFEPFYSTKNLAKHRGLGLSSAYGIITNHDGLIDIQSRPRAGTTVSIFLPAADQKEPK